MKNIIINIFWVLSSTRYCYVTYIYIELLPFLEQTSLYE